MRKFFTLQLSLICFFAFQQVANGQLNLSNYVRVGRYDLPEPTRTTAPPNNLLAQEVSAVTFNWDTETLFVVGDGGTSIVQVSKTGQLINSMTLAQGSSPQGTEFYDPEGLSYIGNGQFVLSEERDRQIVLFTYVAGSTLTRSNTQTVKLGTFVQNIGIEGLSYDPLTGGYICVKEIQPLGIFQTEINFAAGTATNGSATTENSVNLFDPALTTLPDFADIFALSTLTAGIDAPFDTTLLVLSQESGQVVHITRSGQILGILNIVSDPGNPLSLSAQQHEGLTMDRSGNIYIVSENGGGGFDFPQLWVYAPATSPNTPPSAISLSNATVSIPENTSTLSPIKVADIVITDDGLGVNNTVISGPDAAFFQITGNALFIKQGTVLDFETKTSYTITVSVDDSTVGLTPDASTNYTLSVTDIVNESGQNAALIISEVAPWSSGNSPVGADWFELTNIGTTAINISGWKMDDNSNSFVSSVLLNGITSIAPGESVIFIESAAPATVIPLFQNTWFGANLPVGLQIGTYTGSGVGLSTGGDAVNIFDASGQVQAKVSFGVSPSGPFPTFNNGAAINNNTISTLSIAGVNGAFVATNDVNEVGSPGTIGKTIITEVAPWSSGNSPVGADWFEITNTRAIPITITGWKMDDNSGSPAAAVLLNGITTINPGESVIFIETATPMTTIPTFASTWFGSSIPAGLQIGSYTGGGVGLGTGGDAVNIYNSSNVLQASVIFGASPTGLFRTFDNVAGLNNTTISQLSQVGINGAFVAINDVNEIGSPGRISNPPCTPTSSTTTLTVCDSLQWNGSTYTISGTYTFVTLNAGGCDSTATLHLTVNRSSSSVDSVIANTSYTWNGITYTMSGTYTRNFINAAGCDSLAVLQLQINPNQAPTVQIASPTAPVVAEAGNTIIVEASAADSDGTVRLVELYVDGVLFKTDSVSPFVFTNTKVPVGNFVIQLKAYDEMGASSFSDTLLISITACTPGGSITAEGYTNISGSAVADLLAHPSYPGSPSVVAVLNNTFEYRNATDNYGARIRGYFCAPATGLYRFSIAADDQAGIWLSTNRDTANKVLIAYNLSPTGFRNWNSFVTQQSQPIELIQGASYYFEVLHKEAVGSDYLSIGITFPNGVFEAPVSTSRFSSIITGGSIVFGAQQFAESMERNNPQAAKAFKLSVAPNPSNNIFTLRIVSGLDAKVNVRIFDLAGRMVESRINIPSNSTVQVGNGLPAGIYFAEVEQANFKQRLKLIKQ